MKLFLLFVVALELFAVTVPTAHYDNSRDGANLLETTLTPAVVASGRVRKLGTYTVDGDVYAQPLYVPDIGGHNVVIVATLHNKVYSFDADAPGSAALWTRDLGAQRLTGLGFLYSSNVGCLSTPAIDVAAAKIYVVCEDNTPTYTLYVLSLTDGSVITSVVTAGEAVGTGDTAGPQPEFTDGANIVFTAAYAIQRSAITLANGNVYVAYGSYDVHPYHGWVFGYNKTTLAPLTLSPYCTTPNGYGGAIWATPGPAVDADGNLYFSTGNGHYDGLTEFADSVVKLSPTLAFLDWFAPNDQAALEADDVDVSSGGPFLIPGTTKLGIAGKDFNVFILDSACMGGLQGSSGCSLQAFITKSAAFNGGTGSFGHLYMNGHLYLPVSNGFLYDFAFNSGTGLFNTTAVLSSSTFASPGPAQLAGSANASTTGVVWVSTVLSNAHTSKQAATLRALDPVTLVELWNSDLVSTADAVGTLAKYASPLVANGRVYVATTSNAIAIYGVVPAATRFVGVTLKGHVTIK